MHARFHIVVIVTCLTLFSFVSAQKPAHPYETATISEKDFTIETTDQQELTVYHYPADGNYLVIWVASSYGLNKRSYYIASELSKRGVEVWQVDIAESLFETRSSSFMRSLTGQYVHELIEAAHKQTGKEIVVIARAYGAMPVLKGVHRWQETGNDDVKLAGVILFSPDLYASIPELGEQPTNIPITRSTNIPIMIFQGGDIGSRWQLPQLLSELRHSGSDVYFSVIPDVIDLLYGGDTSPATLAHLYSVTDDIVMVIKVLSKTPTPVVASPYEPLKDSKGRTLDDKLRPFNADLSPTALNLKDAQGNIYKKDAYLGKVVVVNFWATWCPPCIEEIPSLNRLRAKMAGKDFELISINYAESPEVVEEFLKQVRVDFPVLLDVDGRVSAQWNVIAFPSTFVIGPDGKIKYGVNAAILWDSPEVIQTLDSLINSK